MKKIHTPQIRHFSLVQSSPAHRLHIVQNRSTSSSCPFAPFVPRGTSGSYITSLGLISTSVTLRLTLRPGRPVFRCSRNLPPLERRKRATLFTLLCARGKAWSLLEGVSRAILRTEQLKRAPRDTHQGCSLSRERGLSPISTRVRVLLLPLSFFLLLFCLLFFRCLMSDVNGGTSLTAANK